MIVEDADRLTDQAANALLKAIEEPTDRTVWMLCAPTVEDVLPTIRSRSPPGGAGHARRRGRRRLPGPHATASTPRARVVRRPRQPGPHRPGPGAGPRRGHPQPAPRGGLAPGRLTVARAVHDRRRQPRTTPPQEEADRDHRRHRRPRACRPRPSYGVVERGRRPREYAPGAAATSRSPRRPGPSGATSTWSTAA